MTSFVGAFGEPWFPLSAVQTPLWPLHTTPAQHCISGHSVILSELLSAPSPSTIVLLLEMSPLSMPSRLLLCLQNLAEIASWYFWFLQAVFLMLQ